jgi:hypothetical protein
MSKVQKDSPNDWMEEDEKLIEKHPERKHVRNRYGCTSNAFLSRTRKRKALLDSQPRQNMRCIMRIIVAVDRNWNQAFYPEPCRFGTLLLHPEIRGVMAATLIANLPLSYKNREYVVRKRAKAMPFCEIQRLPTNGSTSKGDWLTDIVGSSSNSCGQDQVFF